MIPGTLTVIAGAAGTGKTQLGLKWANEGLGEETVRGVICDLTGRGDSQNHRAYAIDQFGWELRPYDIQSRANADDIRHQDRFELEIAHPFVRSGRRVTRKDLDADKWHEWQTELAGVLESMGLFLYSRFAAGARRVVFDGVEPSERMGDSIQFELFEYLYHRIIRAEYDWAAREILRQRFRENKARVHRHAYDHSKIGCVFLYTTPAVLLDDLLAQPLTEGDVFSNASTIILMGRVKKGDVLGRALCVTKHRGSACDDGVHEYRLTDHGLEFLTP